MIPAKEIDGELWVKASDHHQAIKEALAQTQEPVIDKSAAIRIATSLGWSPPRTWVRLTDEELADCLDMSIQKTCRAIEAKLKEKNT